MPTSSSALCSNEAARQASVITTTTITPQTSHHHVGIIVGACLGAAGAILLVGVVLFWLLLRHRRLTETAGVQDMGRRSWARCDFLGGQSVIVIANHRSRSIDLACADTDNTSVAPAEPSETKQLNKSTEVLDIRVENVPQSPPPPLPLQEPKPIELSNPVPPLRIHTDFQPDLSPLSSHSSTPAGPSHSSIRPLPTPPTGLQARRHRSPKTEEAHGELGHGRPQKILADDVRASTDHFENSMCYEAGGYGTLQHHNGGMNTWTDFPPPYSES